MTRAQAILLLALVFSCLALVQTSYESRRLFDEMNRARDELARLDCSLPVLYRQYVELCAPEGVRFLAFGTDPSFGHCVDGLIRLDLDHLKPAKRARYLGPLQT